MRTSCFTLLLIVSPRSQSVVHHVHESMGGVPTPARRLHLELAERARRISCRHERRQPEFRELHFKRLCLLALDPTRSGLLGLPGLAREGVDGGRVEFELALRSMS
jgi:hypothetical protein